MKILIKTRKILCLSAIIVFIAINFGTPLYAQTTVLPNPGDWNCDSFSKDFKDAFNSKSGLEKFLNEDVQTDKRAQGLEKLLGCAIKTGKIKLFMLPFFVTYFVEFLVVIAGLVAVLFVAVGGFKYVVGGLEADKETGKKTVTHALIGLVVALSAWIIVNFVQIALTS